MRSSEHRIHVDSHGRRGLQRGLGRVRGDRRRPLEGLRIAEVMGLFEAPAGAEEVCVERVKSLRNAEAEGRFAQVFQMLNGVAR